MRKSAGILLYKVQSKQLEFFLVHPGGPFWKNKDSGAWSIPKGEFGDDEDSLEAAIREMEEETGLRLSGNFIELTPVRQKSGKIVYAWALEGDVDADAIRSNTFELEWPIKSGKMIRVPEVDKTGWFNMEVAKEKINSSQFAFLSELKEILMGD